MPRTHSPNSTETATAKSRATSFVRPGARAIANNRRASADAARDQTRDSWRIRSATHRIRHLGKWGASAHFQALKPPEPHFFEALERLLVFLSREALADKSLRKNLRIIPAAARFQQTAASGRLVPMRYSPHPRHRLAGIPLSYSPRIRTPITRRLQASIWRAVFAGCNRVRPRHGKSVLTENAATR